MIVDDVVEAIFRRLCIAHESRGRGADLSVTELRLALGVTEDEIAQAVHVLQLAGARHVVFTAGDRMTLGTAWRERCVRTGPV